METENKMSKGGYLFKHVTVIALAVMWYREIMFRRVAGLTYTQSKWVFCVLLGVIAFLGILSTWNCGRSDWYLVANILVPIGMYTVLSYGTALPMLSRILIIASVAVCEVDAGRCVIKELHWRRRNARIRLHLPQWLRTGAVIAGCCLWVILFVGSIAVLGKFAFFPSATAENTEEKPHLTIADNLDILAPLVQEEVWQDLSTDERLRILETVADIEADSLGLPHELNVQVASLPVEKYGDYVDATHQITLNKEYFDTDPAIELLDAICHEAFHAYQNRLVDVYIAADEEVQNLRGIRDIAYYEEEFLSYTDGADDYDGYYGQACERDARAYATTTAANYVTAITYLLGRRGT